MNFPSTRRWVHLHIQIARIRFVDSWLKINGSNSWAENQFWRKACTREQLEAFFSRFKSRRFSCPLPCLRFAEWKWKTFRETTPFVWWCNWRFCWGKFSKLRRQGRHWTVIGCYSFISTFKEALAMLTPDNPLEPPLNTGKKENFLVASFVLHAKHFPSPWMSSVRF